MIRNNAMRNVSKSDNGMEYSTPSSPNLSGNRSAKPTPNTISLTIDRIVDSRAFPIACKKIKQALFTQAKIIMHRYILNAFIANAV